MQAIMKEFAIESERMEMTEEMMSDTIDDVMEGDEAVGTVRSRPSSLLLQS
jgi:hypothetical protein